MVAFPAASYLVDALRTRAEMKQALIDWLAATLQLPGAAASSELTIASGLVTPTRFLHTVDTEADAASDDLDFIGLDNLPDGALLVLRPENAARVVTLRHDQGGDGEIMLAGSANLALDDAGLSVWLERRGAAWHELFRTGAGGGGITAGTPLVLDPYAVNQTVTQAHGLGAEPDLPPEVILECLTAELGYTAGQRIRLAATTFDQDAEGSFTLLADATNQVLVTHQNRTPHLTRADTRLSVNVTAGNWKLIVTPLKRS